MGMSASQARLLSITSRLTNNEFRSQTITNSKLRLAEKSAEASDAYLEALGSKELMYMNYNDNGESSKISLTPASLYDYAPMKNQYLIQNSLGKFLLSNTDINNYEKSDDLINFLKCYDLVNDTIVNNYYDELKQYKSDKEKYDKDYAIWLDKYNKWKKAQSEPSLYDDFVAIMGTSDNPKSCYSTALNSGPDNVNCYVHVLAHMLEWPGDETCSNTNFETSIGTNVQLDTDDIKLAAMHELAKSANYKAISDAINDEEKYLCDRDDEYIPPYRNNGNFDEDKKNNLKTKLDNGETLTERDILLSDYKYNETTGEFTVKSIKQKAIDLLYVLKNNGSTPYRFLSNQNEVWDTLVNFTDGDLRGLQAEDPGEIDPPPIPPKKPTVGILVKDQEKSQWYTNLWHAMNGSDTSNTVDPINFDNDDGYLAELSDDIKREYRFMVENATKDAKQTNYEMLDINLNSSAEWLEFALEHGVVSLVQAQYYNPDEDSNKTANVNADGFKWNHIIYTSARDIVSQDDQQAIAIAEINYKNTLKEIENEDKKFDQDLKRLDAEHSALQTEYESIKEVISKNTERSFKAFS